jgi:hypothetical protein
VIPDDIFDEGRIAEEILREFGEKSKESAA